MEDILDFLKKHFDSNSTNVLRLSGYANANYSFQANELTFVLKTYPFDPETEETLLGETDLLFQVKAQFGSLYPVPVAFTDGKFVQKTILNGSEKLLRVLSFVGGEFLGNLKPNQALYASLGSTLAKLNQALQPVRNTSIRVKESEWDLHNFLKNKFYLNKIQNPSERKILSYYFQHYQMEIEPKKHQFRRQIIHGDVNEWNVLCMENRVTSLIDFGDACYSALVYEVAIALTYVMYDKDEPLDWSVNFLKAYHQINPLQPDEVDLLYWLIAARLCTSLCQSAHARELDPANDYASVSEKSAWQMIHKWIKLSPIQVSNWFRQALQFPKIAFSQVEEDLEYRHRFISPLLSISYKRPLSLSSSAFQYFFDKEGNSILDAYNNIPHVGHCHPKVVEAGMRQMARLNTNTRYLYDVLPAYAEKLLAKFPSKLNRIFFVNSGSAASDLAMRIAQAHTGNRNVLVMEHGYHGNTQLSIDISDYKFSNKKGQGQKPHILKATLPDTYLGEYKDLADAGKRYAGDAGRQLQESSQTVGAFVAEPIVGCGGQVPLAPGYLASLYPIIREQGGICISDEVQTGFGRVGDHFWGFEMHGVIPDMVILGKPMGNGHPIGAVVTTEEIAQSFEQGVEFFSSFGGNPVSCQIGLAVLEVIEEEGLQQNAKEVGDYYQLLLRDLAKKHACIGDVRGSGLFLGAEIVLPGTTQADPDLASFIKNELRNQWVLISTDGPNDNVLKTKPPLCFSKENALEVVEKMDELLTKKFAST
ncbi:aminotransferase class III-fold pyridoxal phosphate-dependent enzyme [Algoriphagus namhaensis]